MAIVFSESENNQFRQLVMLLANILWLAASTFYFDQDWPVKFAIIRCIFFFFAGVTRCELAIEKDKADIDRDDDVIFGPSTCKAFQVWAVDFLSWGFLSWAFGISLFQPWELFQCAWVLSFMTLPERVYSPYQSFLWQATLRTEDYRKQWMRKANLQMISVPLGALLGASLVILDDPNLRVKPMPHTAIQGACLMSTLVNSVNYLWF